MSQLGDLGKGLMVLGRPWKRARTEISERLKPSRRLNKTTKEADLSGPSEESCGQAESCDLSHVSILADG